MFDIIVLLILALYSLKGFNKGGIYASFQFVGYIVAFLVAFLFAGKVSAIWLSQQDSVSVLSRLIPFLTYLFLFFGIIFLTKIIAKSVISFNKVLMLGWLDKLIGAVIYAAILIVFGGVLVWLGHKLGFVSDVLLQNSHTAGPLLEVGNFLIENISDVLPFIKKNADEFLSVLQTVKTNL